jgi:hypothetical protein
MTVVSYICDLLLLLILSSLHVSTHEKISFVSSSSRIIRKNKLFLRPRNIFNIFLLHAYQAIVKINSDIFEPCRSRKQMEEILSNLEGRCVLAIPKKGRLHEKIIPLLEKMDIQFVRQHRLDIALSTNHANLAILFLPAADIPLYTSLGKQQGCTLLTPQP